MLLSLTQAVRLASSVDPPAHLTQGTPGSRMRLPRDASVQQAAAAVEPQRQRVVRRAEVVGATLNAPASDTLDRELGGEMLAAANHLGTAASGCARAVHIGVGALRAACT